MQNRLISRGVRTVALLEAGKAAIVVVAGLGLLSLIHRDLHALATHLVAGLHLNPAKKYPRIFIDAVDQLTDARLWMLAGLALLYALFRGIEAYGLWKERAWAEWFALVTGAIYLPFEIYELSRGVNAFKVAALVVNLAIVAWLAYVLYRTRQEKSNADAK